MHSFGSAAPIPCPGGMPLTAMVLTRRLGAAVVAAGLEKVDSFFNDPALVNAGKMAVSNRIKDRYRTRDPFFITTPSKAVFNCVQCKQWKDLPRDLKENIELRGSCS